jgi:hypothetical protein
MGRHGSHSAYRGKDQLDGRNQATDTSPGVAE